MTMSFVVPVPSAGPRNKPLENPITVISSQFLASYPVDLRLEEKMLTLKEGTFDVKNVDGQVMFTIKGSTFTLHDTRRLLDGAGTTILTFRQKMFSLHRRWDVYRGESTDSKDLVFWAKKTKVFQLKTQIDVFLAANTTEDQHDFKVKGSFATSERSCTIYTKDGTIIAQMRRDCGMKNTLIGKDVFEVTVYPNVDFAFIVAVLVVLHEVNQDRSGED